MHILEEAQMGGGTTLKDYLMETTTKFVFEHVLTRFGCPNILLRDHGMHFLNEMINALTKEFQVYHQKNT